MALRQFAGQDGSEWQVWLVKPTTNYTPTFRPPERRSRNDPPPPVERRINRSDTRVPEINPNLEQGWLCFESESEKRRLLPVPQDWATCSDARLNEYLRQAKKVLRHLNEAASEASSESSSGRD